jgi:hypothetical protein
MGARMALSAMLIRRSSRSGVGQKFVRILGHEIDLATKPILGFDLLHHCSLQVTRNGASEVLDDAAGVQSNSSYTGQLGRFA